MVEEDGIRSVKKISRAGSGGYSLYLPKRWINNWSEAQQKEKEIEMFEVGDQLIISPMQSRKVLTKKIEGASQEELIYHMLSAYIRGADNFTITQEGLSDINIGEIRNILRFLDENLMVRAERNSISFENRPVAAYDPGSLIPLLFDKLIEAENLAADLVNDCDTNPVRCIHLMRMLYALEKEDVNRLSLQIFRNLSRCRSPAKDFIDINFKWSSANMLEIIGDGLYGVVQIVCRSYGINPNDLQYPAEYLEKKMVDRSPVLGDAEKLRMQLVIDLREGAIMLSKAKEAIVSGDGKGAFDYKDELREQVRAMEVELADSMGEFSTSGDVTEESFLSVVQISIRVREIMYLTKSLTKRAALIYFSD
jgi:hypothetical protein